MDIDLALPLRALEEAIEREVPAKTVSMDRFEMDPSNRFGIKYRIERDDIRLAMRGDQLRAVVTFRYGMQACHRTGSRMWPCVSCGLDEPLREAVVILDSKPQWTQAMNVRTATTVRPVDYRDRCRVSLFNVDVTDWKIKPFVDEQLRDTARLIDSRVPPLTSVGKDLAALWSNLQQPVEIAPRTWLVLQPSALRLGTFSGDANSLRTSIGIVSAPRVTVGDRPAVQARPLPRPQTAAKATDVVHVPFTVELPFAEAARLMEQHIGGKAVRVGGRDVRIEGIRIARDGDRIQLDGSARFPQRVIGQFEGDISLTGTPVLDGTKLRIRELDYSVAPSRRRVLVRAGEAFNHEEIRAAMEQNAWWEVAPLLEKVRSALEASLNRPLANGARLNARVSAVRPQSIAVREDRFVIAAVAEGKAAIDISPWIARGL
jgi:hypothetical protein